MTDRIYIITGASQGLGLAVAEGLAEAGAHIVLIYSSQILSVDDKASSLAQRHGVKVINIICDVTDFEVVERLVLRVSEELGKVDVFIANAGICDPRPILEQSLDDYHAQINVNVHSFVHCAKAVGPIPSNPTCHLSSLGFKRLDVRPILLNGRFAGNGNAHY